MTILITGITGTLGRAVMDECLNRGHSIVGIGHSEKRCKDTQIGNPEVKIYSCDILDANFVDRIVKRNNVEYIVHCAAMKHIGICENNPTRAVDVNINGSRNIIDIAYKYGVKNVVAVSTDKAINPSCVYGSTKLIMEKLMLESNYSVIQGVNFFFSSGSVLDIWEDARTSFQPIRVSSKNTVRYFVDAGEVGKKILDSLDMKGEYIRLERCYRVFLHDLATAFCQYHQYENQSGYELMSVEKAEEEVPAGLEIINAGVNELKAIFADYYYVDQGGPDQFRKVLSI